jgi:Asp-tRNA(Asn)/Glu-tRNA(Gln) amidotransferase A subunit family amidase
MDSLLFDSATRLAARIRTGEISSERAVAVHIEHARRTHGHIHAVVADRYDAAMTDARSADAHMARQGREGLPPLFGVDPDSGRTSK